MLVRLCLTLLQTKATQRWHFILHTSPPTSLPPSISSNNGACDSNSVGETSVSPPFCGERRGQRDVLLSFVWAFLAVVLSSIDQVGKQFMGRILRREPNYTLSPITSSCGQLTPSPQISRGISH